MNLPWQINPALSKPRETPLQAFDRSQRGRRLADLDESRKRGALTKLQRETYRTLAAERRAIVEELSAVSDQRAAKNVVRMPGGTK
jgi:hypothetical protein